MARRRSKTADDWRRFKKFEEENEKLRKEVSKLRKIVNSKVVDVLEEREKRVDVGLSPRIEICEICGNEDISKIPIKRVDGVFEIKVCNSCNHRSQLKKT